MSKYRYYQSVDRRHAIFGVDEPARIEDVLDVEEFRQTTYYQQFHLPYDVGDVLIAKIIDDAQRKARFARLSGKSVHIALEDVERFRALCPHIRRVVTISDLLEQRTVERDSLAEVLNHLAAPVIMVDPKQRIVHSNTAAQEFLAEGKTLSSVRGVLTASDPRNQEGLRRVTRAPDLDAKSLAFESDEGPLTVATVLPLTSGLRASYGKQLSASAAIFVHNQPSFDEGMVTTLAKVFGLTGAEARVSVGAAGRPQSGRNRGAVSDLRQHRPLAPQAAVRKDQYQPPGRPDPACFERDPANSRRQGR